jgi:multisubunit Na+/H+ antiporter MnhE subunit
MWIELQKNENAKDRVNFIHRFWVMQAMFEGLMTSCLVAFAAVLELKYSFGEKFAWGYFVLLIALCLILFWRCMIAAKENAEVQIREIILSYYSYIKSNQIWIL